MSEYVSQPDDGNFEQVVLDSGIFQGPTESSEPSIMSSWQLIFSQSRVNNGAYNGDRLPAQNWDWPQGTWLQTRLRYLRGNRRYSKKFTARIQSMGSREMR